MATITPSEISLIVVLTTVAVGGVKLSYAYAASRWLALTVLFKAQSVVQNTVGGVMVGTGLYTGKDLIALITPLSDPAGYERLLSAG